MSQAPVALFVYNRPGHTRQTVEALAANTLAAETPLYVFSDAPKSDNARQSVDEVRSYIRTISGFKSITIVERETNFGLARSIIEGVTNLCEQYGRVIVLEDDLVTSPHFISYMNHGLMRYEHDDRVMQIAGYMFPMELEILEDALFLPFITSWGWATWDRAWQHFDAEANGYETLTRDGGLRDRFDLGGRYRYFKMLQAQQTGRVDSWAIRWYLSVFLRGGLALWPKTTMVRNVGFDGSGVNCVVSKFEDSPLNMNFQVLAMPQQVEVSAAYDFVLVHFPVPTFSAASLFNRIRGYLARFFRLRFMHMS